MYLIIKGVFDVIMSIIIFPFFVISLLIIGPIIYINDKGPIFYKSRRIGKDGRVFNMIKYRTMYINSPDIRLEDGSTFNSENDNRVTSVGKFLRKTSIDEIPQILNVLIGDMSIIGNRADPIDWLEKYSQEEKIILKVKPGITGYNQAFYRNSSDGQQKLKNDVYYVHNMSLKFDIIILFKTIETVFLCKNINSENK